MDAFCDHNYFKPGNSTPQKNIFQFHICPVIFKHHGSFYKLLKRVHKVKNFGTNNIKYQEEECNERFNRPAELEAHLKNHPKKIEKQKLSFGSLGEFRIWDRELEKETESEYLTYTSGSKRATLYFEYSRSELYKEQLSQGTRRRRRLKGQGSKKSGVYCISRMIFRINDSDGTISVKCCKTHYGCKIKLARV